MKTSWFERTVLTVAIWLATSGVVAAAEETSQPSDFRGKVMIGYGSVFAVILIFLFASYRRNVRMAREVELLEERVRDLGK